MIMDLEFGGKKREPDIRWLYDLRDVIYDQNWLAKAKNTELYYMYRDLFLSKADGERLREQGVRYDITIIPPGMLGCEYVKTIGHYHPLVPGEGVTFPEIYEILEGEALYLLQKLDLSDVVAVNASAGDKVLVPPGYGHITINRSNRTLKMANFVARDFSSLYGPIKERAGGAYYFTDSGWIKNKNCPEAVELRRSVALGGAKMRSLGLVKSREMYPLLKEKGSLDYLVKPQDHLDLFDGLL